MSPLRPAYALAALFFVPYVGLQSASGSQATGNGGTIQGSVTDPSGAVIAGADVTLSNSVSGYNRTVKTGTDGSYRLPNIPPNQYHLQISAAGFQTFNQDVPVRTQVPIQINAALSLSGSTETVTVQASAEVLENVPAAHTDVDQQLLANLPISSNAQGLSDAITLTSGGVVADSNGFFHPQGDHAETSYVVDGQPITDQQSKTFSTQMPANAFQSLELTSTAPGAEYGDKTGLVVSAVTRSGLGQRPTGSLVLSYGSFGTLNEEATFGIGSSHWGNFLVVNTDRSGRFLDSPEFTPFHDIGNNENIFDRIDYQPGSRDSLHLNIFAARNWFQIPNTYDQLQQDQRQQVRTFSFALGYQHTFSPQTLLTINPFVRQDLVGYYPSSDPFNDTPATLSQRRRLQNWGTRVDFSFANNIHNVKIGTQLMQYRLHEDFSFGITDPLYNAICANTNGSPVAFPGDQLPNACAAAGYIPNPGFMPGLLPFDLTRNGMLFLFNQSGRVNEEAVYAQDAITLKNLTVNLGLRFDNYDGLSTDKLLQPRVGLSYLLKPTGTVFRASYTRSMETPYNENLLLSSYTGEGGLGSQFSGEAFGQPLRPGHRNQFGLGFQQAITKYLQFDGSYFWKFTKDAFDFDTLFNTPLAFPISWRKSKIDGVSIRLSTINIHGFQAYTTMGHTRARFFGPEIGGLVFNSPLNLGVFRIDHDQAFQQTTFLRYQYGKDGPWAGFTWRFDSGEVAGAVTDLQDALGLTAAQQADIGFYCGNQYAALGNPITSCSANYGATRLNIPAPGTYNADHNPPRIGARNLFDVSIGIDNLLRREKLKTSLKFTAVNITNEAALYNFLSTFSGTHWVTPRTYEVSLGWNF